MDTDWSPLLLSLRAAALAVLLLSPVAIGAALILRHLQGKRRAIADLLLLSPLVLPPTVLGFLLLQLLGPNGPIGQPLQALDITIVFSWSATVISAAVVAFPLMYRSTLASLEQLDPALEAVALGLGCSPLQAFWRVTLPLIRPGVLGGLSLSFARALGEFGTTMMLAGNIPGRTQTLPLAIYSAVENGDNSQAWRLTALVLLLNGGCLALVEQLSRGRQHTPVKQAAADGLEEEVWEVAPASRHLPQSTAPAPLEVAIELRRGSFELALSWSSQAARLAVLGSSGAGKSMLLRCIAGLERPQHGRISLGERLLCDSARGIWVAPQHRRIAMVFQQYALFPHLDVTANVGFGLHKLSPEQRLSRVATLLKVMRLQEQARQFPHQLSGGQCQRVALARALAIQPDLLLLDEPLSSQDSFRRRRLQQWIDDLQRRTGTPILRVTHAIEEAQRLGDELLVLEGGRLLRQGSPQELVADPQLLTVARLTGCQNLSPLHWLGSDRWRAEAWNLEIQATTPMSLATNSWIGLRAHQLRLRPRGSTRADTALVVQTCQLINLSHGAGQVSAYVQISGSQGGLHVDMPSWEWQELKYDHHEHELELVIPKGEILWLQT